MIGCGDGDDLLQHGHQTLLYLPPIYYGDGARGGGDDDGGDVVYDVQ